MTFTKRLTRALSVIACAALAVQAAAPWSDARALQASEEPAANKDNVVRFLTKDDSLNPVIFDDSKGLVILPVIVNGRETKAVLDTGTVQTIIDVGLARQLGLELIEGATEAITRHSNRKVSRAQGVELEVPGQLRVTFDPPAVNLTGLSSALGQKIDVVIGYNIIGRSAVFIDTKTKRLRFAGSGNLKFGKTPFTTVPIKDGTLYGAINGKRAHFKLDTGDTGELIVSDKRWDEYIPSDAALKLVGSSTGFGEKSLNVYTENVPFSLGLDLVTANLRTTKNSVLHENIDAYIGYGFFKGRRVILDYSAGYLLIHKEE